MSILLSIVLMATEDKMRPTPGKHMNAWYKHNENATARTPGAIRTYSNDNHMRDHGSKL